MRCWDDFDWDQGKVTISRSVVGKHEDATKTPGSEDILPLHALLQATLIHWKEQQPSVNGWVFGSVTTGRPYWRDSIAADYLKPAGKRLGVENLGWHSFRHAYRRMLGKLGVDLEVQHQLMRHADISMTMEYGKSDKLEQTRPANAKLVEMLPKVNLVPYNPKKKVKV